MLLSIKSTNKIFLNQNVFQYFIFFLFLYIDDICQFYKSEKFTDFQTNENRMPIQQRRHESGMFLIDLTINKILTTKIRGVVLEHTILFG